MAIRTDYEAVLWKLDKLKTDKLSEQTSNSNSAPEISDQNRYNSPGILVCVKTKLIVIVYRV